MEGKIIASFVMALVLVPVFSVTGTETNIAEERVLDRIDLDPIDVAMFQVDKKNIDVKDVGSAPFLPHISGPTSGLMTESYDYTVVSTDPQGDDVFYRIVWGDCAINWWDGPYKSGEEVTFSHSWCEICCPGGGTFTIYVQAKDIHEHMSKCAEYKVTMEQSRVKNSDSPHFIKIIGSILKRFPALEDMTGDLINPDKTLPDSKQLKRITFGPNGLEEDEKMNGDPPKLVSQIPCIASIQGESVGMFDKPYTFVFSILDNQGDDVYLEIDWGDGATTEAGPYPSRKSVSFTHTWSEFSPHTPRFTYKINVRVSDDTGATSDYKTIKMMIVSTNLQLVFFKSLEFLACRIPALESVFDLL